MCGRINVIDNPIVQWLRERFDIEIPVQTNRDLRPTQSVATIANVEGGMAYLPAAWGIKPSWAKRLLINAKSETVTDKQTFKESFRLRRCLVPCMGWYEWRDEGGARKQKYLFSAVDESPLMMAGIWFPEEDGVKLITLTTEANQDCMAIHHRMPLFIDCDHVESWLFSRSPSVIEPLLRSPQAGGFTYSF